MNNKAIIEFGFRRIRIQPHSIIAKYLNGDLHRFNISLAVIFLYTPWSCNIDILIQIILNKKSFDFLISGRHLKLTRE